MLWKELFKLYVLDTTKTSWFFNYLCHWNLFLLSFLISYLFPNFFFNFRREGATGREQPQGRKVTLTGPKSDIGRAEKSHKGQSVTLECYNVEQRLVVMAYYAKSMTALSEYRVHPNYCYYPYHNWSSRASPIDMWEHYLVTTVPGDGPPNGGARPSVGTMMTTKLDLISINLCLFDDDFNQYYTLQIRLHEIRLDY